MRDSRSSTATPAAAAGLFAAVVGVVGALHPTTALVGFGVLVAAAAVAARPTAATLVLLLVCQEIEPSSSLLGVQTLGHQLYLSEIAQVPALMFVLVFAAAAGIVHAQRAGASVVPPRLIGGIALAAAGILTVSLLDGANPLTAGNAYIRPYLIAALAVLIACGTTHQPGGWRDVRVAGGATLLGLSAVGLASFAAGVGVDPATGDLNVFYDSAVPAAAGAALLAITLTRPYTSMRWLIPLAVATAAIVVLSGRRNVWAAVILVAVAVLVVRAGRGRALTAAAAAATITTTVLVLVAPDFGAALADRVDETWRVVLTGDGDESTVGHLSDLEVGWQYALDRPWAGYGPAHPALPGMAAENDTIYVHNSYLMDWLRFGAVGLLVAMSAALAMIIGGLRALRRAPDGSSALIAAAFLVIAPLSAFTAAFFMTAHWPALIGLAAGAVAASRAGADEASESDEDRDPSLAHTVPAHSSLR